METILIKGPATIKVLGECEILGVQFKNTHITYKNNKILPIEKYPDAKIKILKNNNKNNLSSYEKYLISHNNKGIGTKIWIDTVNTILTSGKRKIIIIGPTDSGKSTFSLFLANKLLNENLRPLLIEGDVGQGDFAPPTCIGSTLLKNHYIDLGDIRANYINFIGGIQPTGYERRIVASIRRSCDKLYGIADVTLINTDGYIHGNGINYKIDLIKKMDPDCVILMRHGEKKSENILDALEKFSKNSKIELLICNSPPSYIHKSISDRKFNRLKMYSKFLKKGIDISVMSIKKIKFIYYKNKYNKIPIFSNEINIDRNDLQMLLDRSFLLNRFVGLSKKEDQENILGFGIIKDFVNNRFFIQTSIKNFDLIFLGEVKLLPPPPVVNLDKKV